MADTVARYTDRAISHYHDAEVLCRSGKLYRAYRQYRIAEEFGYDGDAIRFALLRIDRKNGKLKRAYSGLEKLLEHGCFDGELCLELGKTAYILDLHDQSIEYLKRSFKQSSLRWIKAEALRLLIRMQPVGHEKLGKLLGIVNKAVISPLDSFQHRRTEAVLMEMAGNDHNAFLAYRGIWDEWPEYQQPLKDLARISILMKNYSLAIAALRKYRKRNLHDPEAGRMFAEVHFFSGHYRKAASLLNSYSVSDIANARHFINIANCNILSGKQVAAIRAYRKAIALDPDAVEAFFGLAVLYHQNGSLDTAEDCYRQALMIEPANCRLLFNFGNLLYESGDYNSAIRAFRHCLRINPNFSSAENNLHFVMMAKICYPEDGPESETQKKISFYWISAASIAAIILISVFKGWF